MIVTRPAAAGQRLTRFLERAGYTAWWWPAFDIAPAPDPVAAAARLAALAPDELLIVVSPAAAAALAQLRADWPASITLAAVGAGTAAALRAALGPAPSLIEPAAGAESGSESLWELLHARGLPERVLIARAEHGREWLAEQLSLAGVAVTTLAVYRRIALQLASDDRARLAAALAGPAPVLVFTSSEAVEVVVDALAASPGALEWAQAGQALAIHPRIADRLRAAGFAKVDGVAADDGAILAKLESLRSAVV